MTERRRIYLDNAATSFPKPEPVHAAVDRYQRELGNAVGRGATRNGAEVQRIVDRCRLRAARLFGVSRPEQVIFTFNGTDALNLAIHGLLRENDHVVTTVWEHNSVLRPLKSLEQTHQVSTVHVHGDGSGGIDLEQFAASLSERTRLVILTHASNVTGVLQPVAECVALAKQHGALVLLDAAQTAGHVPISLEDSGIDLIACPGHKGLLGPLGTGLLVIRSGLESELHPIRQGGTGTVSESDTQPESLPDRYESGNHNAPGLVGLEAALNWIEEQGGVTAAPASPGSEPASESHSLEGETSDRGEDGADSQRHGSQSRGTLESSLIRELITGLRELPGVTVHYADEEIPRVGVVSISMDRVEPQVLASLLDDHFRIETRAGLHCAPRAHEELGTRSAGGTVRFSTGPFTTGEEIDQTLEALGQIAASL